MNKFLKAVNFADFEIFEKFNKITFKNTLYILFFLGYIPNSVVRGKVNHEPIDHVLQRILMRQYKVRE